MARGRLNLLMKFKNIHFKVLFQFFSTQNLAHHHDMGELLLPANKVSWSMKPTIHLFDYMAPTL